MDEVQLPLDDLNEFQTRVQSVYLASPLTGLRPRQRSRVDACREVIESAFYSHMSTPFCVYDPARHTAPGSQHTASEVHDEDLLRVANSDLFVALPLYPSTGLGIEAAYAASCVIPRIVIADRRFAVSRMFTGMTAIDIDTVIFSSLDELRRKLRGAISKAAKYLAEVQPNRRQAISAWNSDGIGRFVLRRRIQLGMSRQQLGQSACISPEQIRLAELNPAVARSLSIMQFTLLTGALHAHVSWQGNKPEIRVNEPTRMPIAECDSLETLVDFIVSMGRKASERAIFAIWGNYREMRHQALAGRQDIDECVTKEQWAELYRGYRRLF